MRQIIICLSLPLFLWGCAGNSESQDAGTDGLVEDAGTDAGGDEEPEQTFFLRFEAGAQACAHFSEGRTAAQELALGARLQFAPGLVELSSDQDFFEADLIESVHLGPQGLVASPTGPGEFAHQFEEELWGWCHRFIFTQAYTFGDPARPWRIEADFEFCRKNAEDDPFELVFDLNQVGEAARSLQASKRQVRIRGFLDQGVDYLTEKQFFRSCTYNMIEAEPFTIHLESEDGALVVDLNKRMVPPIFGSGEAAIVDAQVSLDTNQIQVTDPLRLAYRAELHNLDEGFLVVLDPPIAGAYGIHWRETGITDPPALVNLLDENLDPAVPLESKAVGNYTETAE